MNVSLAEKQDAVREHFVSGTPLSTLVGDFYRRYQIEAHEWTQLHRDLIDLAGEAFISVEWEPDQADCE